MCGNISVSALYMKVTTHCFEIHGTAKTLARVHGRILLDGRPQTCPILLPIIRILNVIAI